MGIYDLLHDSGAALILMELCDSDLSNRLLEKKKLQNDEIYSIMVDTASGLRYMQALSKDSLIQMLCIEISNRKIC